MGVRPAEHHLPCVPRAGHQNQVQARPGGEVHHLQCQQVQYSTVQYSAVQHSAVQCRNVAEHLYNMTREEYDSCRISQADPRVVAVCDKPHTQLQFTITFR